MFSMMTAKSLTCARKASVSGSESRDQCLDYASTDERPLSRFEAMVPPHVHKHLTEHNCQDSDGLKEAKKLLQSHKIEHGQQGVHDPRGGQCGIDGVDASCDAV
jgi:hypothetical protein